MTLSVVVPAPKKAFLTLEEFPTEVKAVGIGGKIKGHTYIELDPDAFSKLNAKKLKTVAKKIETMIALTPKDLTPIDLANIKTVMQLTIENSKAKSHKNKVLEALGNVQKSIDDVMKRDAQLIFTIFDVERSLSFSMLEGKRDRMPIPKQKLEMQKRKQALVIENFAGLGQQFSIVLGRSLLFRDLVEKLKINLDKWLHASSDEEASYQEKFLVQCENLREFCRPNSILSKFSSNFIFASEEKGIKKIAPSSNIILKEEGKLPLQAWISPLNDPSSRSFEVKKPPITAAALKAQKEVIVALASAKSELRQVTWESTEPKIGNNTLYPLKTAYFKQGEKDKIVGQIEKFMWDVACILGFEDSFAPTVYTSISSVNARRKTGSLQPKLNGCDLSDISEDEISKKISRKQLVSATMKTLIMGMFDAHKGNIRLVSGKIEQRGEVKVVDAVTESEETRIIFFDNSRCLPNSNGVILWGEDILSAFHSDLILLEGSRELLTRDERRSIQKEASECLARMDCLREFMRKNKPKDLAPGIIEMSSLDAMEERLTNILRCIEDPSVTTLEELTFAVIPDYKLITALTILYYVNNSEQLSSSSDIYEMRKKVGRDFLNEILIHAELHIDLNKIKELADSNVSLAKLLEIIKENWKAEKIPQLGAIKESSEAKKPSQLRAIKENRKARKTSQLPLSNILKYFFNKAACDGKDCFDAEANVLEATCKKILLAGITPTRLILNFDAYTLEYRFTRSHRVIIKEIDCLHPPGHVRIDGILIKELALMHHPENLEAYLRRKSEQKFYNLIGKLISYIQISSSMPTSLSSKQEMPFLVYSSDIPRDLFYCYYKNGKLVQLEIDWRSNPKEIYLNGIQISQDKFPLLSSSSFLQELYYQGFLDSCKKHERVHKTLPSQLTIGKPYLWENEVKGEAKGVVYSCQHFDGTLESQSINLGEEWPQQLEVDAESFLTIESFLTYKKLVLQLERQGISFVKKLPTPLPANTQYVISDATTTPPTLFYYYCNADEKQMKFRIDYLPDFGLYLEEKGFYIFRKSISLNCLPNLKNCVEQWQLDALVAKTKRDIELSGPTQFFAEAKRGTIESSI